MDGRQDHFFLFCSRKKHPKPGLRIGFPGYNLSLTCHFALERIFFDCFKYQFTYLQNRSFSDIHSIKLDRKWLKLISLKYIAAQGKFLAAMKWDGQNNKQSDFNWDPKQEMIRPQGRVLNASLIALSHRTLIVAKKALAGDSWWQDVLRLEEIKQPIMGTSKLYYQQLNLPLLLLMHSHISLRKYLRT